MKIRYEIFGGIIATEDPPACVFVDRDYLLNLDGKSSPRWEQEDSSILSAPIEAHYAISNYCSAGCTGCYMGSEQKQELLLNDEASFERAKEIARTLAEMNIFHVALGGGESFAVPWFLELAAYFRSLGIVPNVTTNGYHISDEIAAKCSVFGQVNVSLDTVGTGQSGAREKGSFEKADRAITALKKQGIRTGINCVISRANFNSLNEIIAYAKQKKLVDIEFLRFKPAGRGKDIYRQMALTQDQAIALFPRLKKLARKYRVGLKLDCSFTPFICYHKPSKKALEFFSILGCDAGNWLIGVSPEGMASPCSFVENMDVDIKTLQEQWDNKETFSEPRFWDRNTDSVCKSCEYVSICKGGCHAVSRFVTGSFSDPDPECPVV
ncbi:MAG: radical SAM protein, partial [bacterium]|nr:radical SAM protein [bacterium]